MSVEKHPTETKDPANEDLITKKLELVAKIRELQHESAKLNVELFKRGVPGPCW